MPIQTGQAGAAGHPAAPVAPPPPGTEQDLGAQIRQQVQERVQQAIEQSQAAQERGATVVPPIPFDPVPQRAVDISVAFFVMIAAIVIFTPLARAFARRLERSPAAPALDPGLTTQLQRIEQSVDAMAIEIERISEAQRYLTRLQTESATASRPLSPGS